MDNSCDKIRSVLPDPETSCRDRAQNQETLDVLERMARLRECEEKEKKAQLAARWADTTNNSVGTACQPDNSLNGKYKRATAEFDTALIMARIDNEIRLIKDCRRYLDEGLVAIKGMEPSLERANAAMFLKTAIMWLGQDLSRLGTPNPYPTSYGPTNTRVEPQADGLKG